jgi:protein-S-isoprenylcysteine O-methyltransferase Ste14
MTTEDGARVVRAHLYGTVVIGIFVVLPALVLRRFDALVPFSLPDPLRYPGLALLVAGAVLSYTSFWFFITEGKGTAFPTDPPKELVIRGPYLYVRNPMYVGNLAIIFGAAFYFASAAVLLYAVAMCFVTHFYITASEEPVLIRRYQDPYLQYIKTTPRWLPRLSRTGPAIVRSGR